MSRVKFSIVTCSFLLCGLISATKTQFGLRVVNAALWTQSIESQVKRNGLYILTRDDFMRIKDASLAAHLQGVKEYQQLGLSINVGNALPVGSVAEQAQKEIIRVVTSAQNIANIDPSLNAQQVTELLIARNSKLLQEDWKQKALRDAINDVLSVLKVSRPKNSTSTISLSNLVSTLNYKFLEFVLLHYKANLKIQLGTQPITIDWVEAVTNTNYRNQLGILLKVSKNKKYQSFYDTLKDWALAEQTRYGYLYYSQYQNVLKRPDVQKIGPSLHLVLLNSMLER